jgi:carboxyl-terminal processing protease
MNLFKQNPRTQPAILIILYILLQSLIVTIAFLSGFLVRDVPIENNFFGKAKFPLLSEAYNILKDNALAPLPEGNKLEYGMIRGMLDAFHDPFTVFVEPPQHKLETNQLEGKFGGIGVRIERDAQKLVYLYPLPDSPALKAGIKDGDRLLSVDAFIVNEQSTDDEIQAAIRGPEGEKVKVTVGRAPDYAPVEVLIVRAEVMLPSTTWNISPDEPSVGIIQVHVIAGTTPDEVTKAILDLQQHGAKYFILDIRNNGGGLVDAGVNIARLFLKDGIVMEQRYRGQDIKTYKVEKPGAFTDIPIVLLVNKGTASAAEIFSAALQSQKRALIVGTRTYGKNTIQLVFSLSDGSSIHVTSAEWWVPGIIQNIGGNGLQPDIPVPDNADPNAALQAAIQAITK